MQKGFTYIEMILSLAIIGYIALAFGQLFIRNAISVKTSEFQTLAYTFAADRMEQIKQLFYSEIGDPWYPDDWESVTDTLGQAGKEFTRVVVVSDLSTTKRVDITVSWIERSETHSVAISSLVAKYE